MRSRQLLPIALALLAACGSPKREAVAATAASAAAPGVVVLHNGPNTVDLLGDGHRAQVFVGWRENYNAHGFSTITFYVQARDSLSPPGASWLVVPFVASDTSGERNALTTGEGADCTIRDLRVVRPARGPAQVIVGERERGASSYADTGTVTFTTYALRHNDDAGVGYPTYWYAATRTTPASRPYCDVNEAFARELHLGSNGIGHGEGGR